MRRRVESVFLAQSIGLGGLNKWEDKSQKSAEEVEGKKKAVKSIMVDISQ